MIRFLTFPVFLAGLITALLLGSSATAAAANGATASKAQAQAKVAVKFSSSSMEIGDTGYMKVKIGASCRKPIIVVETKAGASTVWSEMLRLKVPTGESFLYNFTPYAAGETAYRLKVITKKGCARTTVAERTFSAS